MAILILNVFSDFRLFFKKNLKMVIVDDRTAEFLAEVRRALEESRVEAGLPPTTTAAPSLEELAAAVRESGLVGALNHVVATTISSTVSLCFLFFWYCMVFWRYFHYFVILCRLFIVYHPVPFFLLIIYFALTFS
jgi:hypothetical protein